MSTGAGISGGNQQNLPDDFGGNYRIGVKFGKIEGIARDGIDIA